MALAGHPPEVHEAVARLMRGTDRTLASIAAETGVPANTVSTWNRRAGWRLPTYAKPRSIDPAEWPETRRAALARLYHNPEIDLADLAAAMGAARSGGRSLFKACGLAGRRRRAGLPRVPSDPGRTRDGPSLRAALRGHVARQIAHFDAGLDAALQGQGPGVPDSAKVLRDLGGLKRLLDELEAAEARGFAQGDRALDDRAFGDFAGVGHGDAHESAQGGPDARDLPALRAEIARRYAAFAGERPDAGLPGEPAGPSPGIARP